MFPQRLKQLRDDADITQTQLAKKLNLTQSTIAYYESGKKMPTLENVEAIANFFNISVDYLLGRTNIMSPSILSINEPGPKYSIENNIEEEIEKLSPESQEELKKYMELLKIRDMQKKNTEASDELTCIE